MKFDEYQKQAASYDSYEKTDDIKAVGFLEKILGLAGEAGEAADKFKKIIRDKNGKITEEDQLAIAKELGDVLWYVASIARYLDIPLSEVARLNVEKLQSRKERGVLRGSGDER